MVDYVPFNENEFCRWINDSGDRILRLNYNLNSKSIVVDAGGYVGEFANDINSIYDSMVYVLEPLESLCNGIRNRFANNPNIIPLQYAIGNRNCDINISVDSVDVDSSSLFTSETGASETIKCIDVKDFLEENNIQFIDLFKINIEGGEFDLLERLIEIDALSKVDNFQIQFHRFIPDCEERRNKIQEALSKTHELTWNYDWIWENWKLKH